MLYIITVRQSIYDGERCYILSLFLIMLYIILFLIYFPWCFRDYFIQILGNLGWESSAGGLEDVDV